MITRLVKAQVSDLSSAKVTQLASLTFRGSGWMKEQLYLGRVQDVDYHWAYYIEEVETRQVLSWALIFPINNCSEAGVYFYTRESMRRRGFSTRLWKHITNDFVDTFRLFPHDEGSTSYIRGLDPWDRVHPHSW
jgi:GNAT superfamily N-acetyltransferase